MVSHLNSKFYDNGPFSGRGFIGDRCEVPHRLNVMSVVLKTEVWESAAGELGLVALFFEQLQQAVAVIALDLQRAILDGAAGAQPGL